MRALMRVLMRVLMRAHRGGRTSGRVRALALHALYAGILLVVPTLPAAAQEMGTEVQLERGKVLYDKYCVQCHGENGDGNGHAVYRVKPKPRDFTSGKYKFRTTPSGKLPTDVDLFRAIRDGLPYTSMPGWPNLTDQQIRNLVYYLKTFSADFENQEMYGEPIAIGQPLPSTEESLERGRVLYEEQGCGACHGDQGRGDGQSAPTLTDDWGDHIRVADLTQRWTWRGGATKPIIYRTFSTGLNGTPMPSYAEVLEPEDRWHLVNYVYSLGEADEPDYGSLMIVHRLEDELDLERAEELFAGAPATRFPLFGQIVEPGRNFYPTTTSVLVDAVYNRKEIAIRVRWNDLRADTSGENDPALEVPMWDEDNEVGGDEEAGDDSFFGEEEVPDEDFFGEEEVSDDDFFGEAEDDFFGGGDQPSGAEFADAVALQFPSVLPTGNRKPYFIFGDTSTPVDLWFRGLAGNRVSQYLGRGSDSLEEVEADIIDSVASYDQGQWTVIFKRSLRASGGITFTQDQYVPIAFSVWDGFNRERGNKRALSSWFHLYTEPEEVISPVGPMIRAALLVLALELVIVFWIRQRSRAQSTSEDAGELADGRVAT